MKKKFLACTLAALMCLQPTSAVLAEDLDFGEDSTGITEESHLLTEENTEDISDFISSDEEQDSSVSDAEPDLQIQTFLKQIRNILLMKSRRNFLIIF